MKKRKRKPTIHNAASPQAKARKQKRKWRETGFFVLAFSIAVLLVGSGLAVFKQNYDISHDLSVIGKGVPTVVQIHDPQCQLCKQLRRNASSAADRLEGKLLFRIADITTTAGRSLQRRYQAPNVTLLLFDGNGKLRKTLNGVKSDESLHRSFVAHLKRSSPG